MLSKTRCKIIFIHLLLITVTALSGCVSSPKLAPGERLTEELIDAYNKAATDAMSKPKPRAPSGSKVPTVIARSALLKYDRQHVHLFNQNVRQLNYQYYHSYITAAEWHRGYMKLFIDRGVIPNARYRSVRDQYLLKLKGEYRIDEASIDTLRRMHEPWWSAMELSVPRIQIANNRAKSRGINYHFHDLTVVDPPSIKDWAARFFIDKPDAVRAVALHEAAHAVHGQMFGQNKRKVFKEKLKALSEAANGRTNFRSAGEVSEFLADAVEVQLGRAAVEYVATRLVRRGAPIGTLSENKSGKGSVLKYKHDASAWFMLALLEQEQLRSRPASRKNRVQNIRRDGQAIANAQKSRTPGLAWVQSRWVPFVTTTLTPTAVKRIQQEYAKTFKAMLVILTEQQISS